MAPVPPRVRRALLATLLSLPAALVGLPAPGSPDSAAVDDGPPTAAAAAAPATCTAGAPRTRSILGVGVPDEGERTSLLQIPSHRPGAAMPLVVALHGAGKDGRWMEEYSGLSRLSDRDDFAVVYPNAAGPRRFWTLSAASPDGPDDVAFLRALIDEVGERPCIDARRVYVTGVSNGGGLAARLACELSDRIAAVAPVAGGYGSLGPCRPSRPVPVLEIHGTADPVVPYAGTPPDRAGSVPRFLDGWTQRDGCRAVPRRERINARTVRLRWLGCDRGSAVQHLRLAGAGHLWPGYMPGEPWVSGAEVVWRFFRGRTL